MAERSKRYINKVLRLVRAIREEARVDPKDIYSMTVESTSDWAKFGEPEEYRVKIVTTYIWGCIEGFHSSGKKYDYDPCQNFRMQDNGLGEYEFTAFFPSVGGVQEFTLKKEDVFKEEE